MISFFVLDAVFNIMELNKSNLEKTTCHVSFQWILSCELFETILFSYHVDDKSLLTKLPNVAVRLRRTLLMLKSFSVMSMHFPSMGRCVLLLHSITEELKVPTNWLKREFLPTSKLCETRRCSAVSSFLNVRISMFSQATAH